MSALDLTLANPKIKAFFEGTSKHKPIAEFMYVHTHPKTTNFMSQIEVLINTTAQYIQENPKKVGAAHKLLALAEQYSEQISDVNEQSAAKMLDVLKDIYDVCMRYKTTHTLETK
jgi:hypothetical protein